MLVQVVGCSHHGTSIGVRERLAFSPEQTREALDHWRRVFHGVEAVLLSTCNRVEIYAATESSSEPTLDQIATFMARFHGIEPAEVIDHLYRHIDEEAVQHLFLVASGLDSMVLGESQILAQVKGAYQNRHRAGQHRPAVALGVSVGPADGEARGRGDDHRTPPRERPQRGRGRLRQRRLRAFR